MQCQFIAALALAVFAPTLSFADTIGAGYGHDATVTLSAGTTIGVHDTLSNGNRVVYDGSQVWIENDAGAVLQVLAMTLFAFPSFIEADPTQTFAVFGESSTGGLYKLALTPSAPAPLTTLALNYDLVYESANTALVSAAAAGSGNEIYRVNLTTGATNMIAVVSGPSGPIAISGAGDLYYATQTFTFPTPAGAVSIIRWTASQIATGPFPLTEARASVFALNFDGGASMAFDPVFGNLFLSESVFGGTSSIVEIDRTGSVVGDVATSLETMGKVEMVDRPGNGACAAFQPAGRALKYRATNFGPSTTSKIVTLSPRRPQLTSVQNPNNTMTCTLTGGWPNASGYVISGNVADYTSPETAYDLVKHLFWTGMPLNAIRRAGITFPTNASGNGSFTFSNPPGSQGLFVIQVFVTDPVGIYRGVSTTAFN